MTTYGTIQHEVGCASEFDEEEKTNENESPEIKIIHKRKNYNAGKSPLLSIAFARLVLDESHVIKNHKSITARAACRIRSGTRWAVTGTPIHNRLLEFYSLLRFLRVSPFDGISNFLNRWDQIYNFANKSFKILSTFTHFYDILPNARLYKKSNKHKRGREEKGKGAEKES